METPAVRDHAGLSGSWCGDAVPRTSHRRRGDGGGGTDEPDADVGRGQEALTRGADCWIPGVQVVETDALGTRDVIAAITANHKVELVAVGDHTGLDGNRRGDAISSGGWGRCRW